MTLEETLDTLRKANVGRATLDPEGNLLSVEFKPEPDLTPVTPGGVVDADGNAVDFDEGMPPLGRDLVAEANFRKPTGD